jgi:arylsulfatase A-like enzyme
MIPFKSSRLVHLPLGLLAFGTISSCDQRVEPLTRPNVILIILDDMNYFGFGGPEPLQTPNINKLRQSSVMFSKANCQAPICVPSRASFLSGISPHHSGIYLNGSDPWSQSNALKQSETLPELFRRNGYYSFGAGKTFHQKPDDERMAQIFSNHPIPEGNYGPFPDREHRLGSQDEITFDTWWGVQSFPDSLFADVTNTGLVIDFIQQQHEDPFFVTLGLWRPHLPFTAPQRFFDMYDPENIQVPMGYLESDLDDVPAFTSRFVNMFGRFSIAGANHPDYWKHYIHGYYACASFADWNIGRLVEALDNSDYADNTIIWVISDNGFHVGIKSHWEKITLWEPAVITPMLVRMPGMASAGKEVTTPVGLIDIYPTLVDLCQLDMPEQVLDGASLRPFLEDPGFTWDRPSLCYLGENFVTVRSNRYRYIQYPDGSAELYDLKHDPFEWKNLLHYGDYSTIVEEHQKYIPEQFAKGIPGSPNLTRALWD